MGWLCVQSGKGVKFSIGTKHSLFSDSHSMARRACQFARPSAQRRAKFSAGSQVEGDLRKVTHAASKGASMPKYSARPHVRPLDRELLGAGRGAAPEPRRAACVDTAGKVPTAEVGATSRLLRSGDSMSAEAGARIDGELLVGGRGDCQLRARGTCKLLPGGGKAMDQVLRGVGSRKAPTRFSDLVL